MLCLFSAFISGLCTAGSVFCFIDGDIIMGLINAGLAFLNAALAICNYVNR